MLISGERRFIFIHVPKTGGLSVTAALRPFACAPGRRMVGKLLGRRITRVLVKHGILYLNPAPFETHISARDLVDEIGPATFSSFFSFAFVRNPWEWLASAYEWSLSRSNRPPSQRESFDDYIRAQSRSSWPCQWQYLCSNDGELLVDFVGRYESLDQDFAAVARRIGSPATLPRLNTSSRRPYQEYYTPETRDLVVKRFGADIERFGYTFEGSPSVSSSP